MTALAAAVAAREVRATRALPSIALDAAEPVLVPELLAGAEGLGAATTVEECAGGVRCEGRGEISHEQSVSALHAARDYFAVQRRNAG